jgi:hypothetical protein
MPRKSRPQIVYRRPRRTRRRILPVRTLVLILALASAAAAADAWARTDGATRVRLRSAVSGVAARALARVSDLRGRRQATAPACNCSSDLPYTCEEVDSDVFAAVRSDPRLSHLFSERPHRRETYALYADFLRDRFTSSPSEPWPFWEHEPGLVERLDAAERGASVEGSDLAVMLSQLIEAAGGFARRVALANARGELHVVVEAWLEPERKWGIFDPDYNVHLTGSDGVPLSALEIRELVRSGLDDEIVVHAGGSPNTLYLPERRELLLGLYDTLMFRSRASATPDDAPRWDPARQPSATAYVWKTDGSPFHPLYFRETVNDFDRIYFTPCRPGASRVSPGI